MIYPAVNRVAVFGLGYVGCVTAACFARRGLSVIGIDSQPEKVDKVLAGESPIAEPGLAQLISTEVRLGKLTATMSIADAVDGSDIAFIAVGTPSHADGSVDSTTVEQVVEQIISKAQSKHHYNIVVRSTLLPGILEERLKPKVQQHPQLSICNHPEFLREATAISDFDHPPLIVVGADDVDCGKQVMQLYHEFSCPKIVTDTRTAAMVKYVSNAFHALKIGFANEVGVLSKELGIDGRDVMRIACLDKRLNVSSAYLRPGFSFGGSCLPKDLRALSRTAQLSAQKTEIIDSILQSNETHLQRAINLIRSFDFRKLGMIGLAFKAQTDDLRESPLVTLAESLLGYGYELKIYDPDVRVASLVGTNLSYIDQHLPHLAQLLCEPEEIIDHCELVIVSSAREVPEAIRESNLTIINLESVLVSKIEK